MRSFSFIYESKSQLIERLTQYNLNEKSEIFIQIFSGIVEAEFIRNVCREIREIKPMAKIIGTTTAGEILDGKAKMHSCVIVVTEFVKSKVDIISFEGESGIVAKQLANSSLDLLDRDIKAIICFGIFGDFNTNDLAECFNRRPGIVVSGGIAGTSEVVDGQMPTAYVFNGKKVIQQGIVVAILRGEDLVIHNDSSFGWVPIGREYEVTEASVNFIYSIEGVNAREFYVTHLGIPATYELCIKFPITFNRNGVVTSSPVMLFEGNEFIGLSTTVKVGEKIRFGFGNKVDVINGNRNILRNLHQKSVESLFVYSCIGRMQLLGQFIDEDLKPIQDVLPVNGGFMFGEFNHINNENNLYTQTLTVLGLSEDNNHSLQVLEDNYIHSKVFKDDEEIVLHHLLKSTGEELNTLNRELEQKVVEKTYELRKSYETDALTGLPNRRKFISDMKRFRKHNYGFFTISNISSINSFYGIKITDQLLSAISEVLTTHFGSHYKVYRCDDSTFALHTEVENSEEAFNQYQLLQKDIGNKVFNINDVQLSIDTMLIIMEEKDKVLEKLGLAIKFCENHNIGYLLYDDDIGLMDQTVENLMMVNKIKQAIKSKRIVPYFQPIIDNESGEIVKYEALIRMIDDDKIISPFFFLEIAKKAGIYDQLTRIMIEKSFITFMDSDYAFSINLIYNDIINEDTRQLIRRYLSIEKVASRVVFEIVESEGVDDFDVVKAFIAEIKSYGAKIAIDDFGTGYSNFMYLMQLDVDYVKIDGSIIKSIDRDETSLQVAKSIVDIANIMKAKTIGEYVHNEDVYSIAVELGIDYSQGYYFSPPVPKDDIKL